MAMLLEPDTRLWRHDAHAAILMAFDSCRAAASELRQDWFEGRYFLDADIIYFAGSRRLFLL